MVRAPLPAGAGGFRTVPATLGPPAQGRGLQALRPMAASAGPSACAATFRAACRGLTALGEAFYFSCCWIGTTAYALRCRFIRLISSSVTLAATALLTLARWVAAAFWLIAFGLAAGAGRPAVSALGAGERGMSWLGPRSRSLNHWIARAVSFGLSRLAALTVSLGAWLIGTIKGQIKTLATGWREGAKRPAERLEPSRDR